MEDKINNTIKSYCNDLDNNLINDCINEISKQYINNKSFYNNIEKLYILSDIHGDIHKYLSFLSKINLINDNYIISNDYDIYKVLNNYFTYNNKEYSLNKNIYDIIKDILNQLNISINNKSYDFKNTIIIQMGDIFDGHLDCKRAEISSFINNDLLIYFISLYLLNEYNIKSQYNNSYYIQLLGNHDFIMYNQIFNSVYDASRLNQEIIIKYYGIHVNPIYFNCENINNYDKKIYEDKGIYLLLMGILNSNELSDKEHFKDIFNKKIQYKKIIFDNIIHFQLQSINNITFHTIISINNNCILSHAFFNNFFDDLNNFDYKLNHIQKVRVIDAIFQYIHKKRDINILFNNKFFNLLEDSLNFRINDNNNSITPYKYLSKYDNRKDFNLKNNNKHYIIGHQIQDTIKLLNLNDNKNININDDFKDYIIWFSDHKISNSFYTDYNFKYKYKYYIIMEFINNQLYNYNFYQL